MTVVVASAREDVVANSDDKVFAAVETALAKNPAASVDELFDLAKGINSSVGRLTKRQFHARYPLQVKRRMNPAKRRRKAAGKTARANGRRAKQAEGSVRDLVRSTFLRFASEVAGAESRKDMVKVVAGVDRYVDDVLQTTGSR
jgi:hypothetical protein